MSWVRAQRNRVCSTVSRRIRWCDGQTMPARRSKLKSCPIFYGGHHAVKHLLVCIWIIRKCCELKAEPASARAYVLFTTINYIARIAILRIYVPLTNEETEINRPNVVYAKCRWGNDDNDAFVYINANNEREHKYVGNWKTRFQRILRRRCSQLFQWKNVKHSFLENAIKTKISIAINDNKPLLL